MKRKLFVILALAALILAAWCTAGAEDYRFITKPQSGSIDPDTLSFRASWETNFVPVKVDVYVDKIDGTFNKIDTLTEGLSKQGHYDYLPDNKASGGFVRVYYGSGSSDYLYATFDISLDSLKFITRPQDGSVDPNLLYYQVNWKTNFVPVKVRIGTKVGYLNYSDIATLEVYLQKEGSYNIPAAYGLKGGYVYAYYGFEADEYVYAYFDISMANVAFIPSFQRINVDPGSTSFTLNWKTTFSPVKIIVKNSDFEVIRTVTLSGQEKTGSITLPFSGDEQKYYLTGFFGNGDKDYINGSVIAGVVYDFSEPPRGGFVYPQESYPISWKTNFVPAHVVIGHGGHGGSTFYTVATLTDTDKSMTYDLSYDDACTDPFWEIRAYKNSTDYVSSGYFRMEKIPLRFTSQTGSGLITPDGTLALEWATNFLPIQVEIGYKTGDIWNSVATLTQNIHRDMSYLLPYNSAHETMYIRAWYDSEQYAESDVIPIEIVPRQFTLQPTGGTVYPWTTHKLYWTVSFQPIKISIGYLSQTGRWVSMAVISTGLGKTMNYVLPYDETINGTMYVRAYYGTETDEWIDSEPVSMVKQAAYVCGDNLTATLDANGVLTLTGAGPMYDYNTLNLPPWFSVSTSIKKIVIPDGVTYIGRTAFYNCKNLTQLDMTPSVTAIGNNAFLACTSLRSVSYDGFKSQWDAINIGDNSNLRNASISYLHRSGQLGTTNVYYELIGRDGSLWIDGYGGSAVHMTLPWADVAQYITELHVDVDTLWEDAFRDCTGVKKVYLSDSLTLVDDGAFNDCTGLTDIYYDSTAADWDSIEILDHNDPLLNAALHTAPHQEQLTVDLSWSVNDEGLLRIWLDNDLMGDGEHTAIPDFASYTDAPWYADYKDVITSLRIESGVTSIGRYAFSHLSKLRTIDIADTVTVIGNWSFSYCTSLEDFTLPDSVTRILGYTFQNCTYLEILHLPDSIQSMGNGVFQNCYNLEKVWLPNGITNILTNFFYNCSLLDYVSLPATVTSIGENAFYGCIELASSTGHVYYGGTSAQWKQISINATGNASLVNCPNIHMTPKELRIDASHFPDAEFRGYVSTNTDADHSGWLTDEEIANVLTIYCGAIDAETLTGIEYFTELEELECVDNGLTELDLSANTKLVHLECQYNTITSLSLEALPGLYYLNCAGNQLTALDVSHQMLEALYCQDNQLTVLDLSGQALEFLDCHNNPLTLLNLSFQPQLEILNCYGTNLAALDLRGCTQLLRAVQYGAKTSTEDYVQYQYVDNKLGRILRLRVDADTELIVPGMIKIDEAHFPDEAFRLWVSDIADSNGSGWLSAEEIDAISEIYLNTTVYADLANAQGIRYFTEATELILEGLPNLTAIDLSENTKLESLEIMDTGLTSLDVSGLPLQYLYCRNNALTSLDVTGCPLLLNAIANGTRTEKNGLVTYSKDSAELTVDAGVQLITGLTLTVTFDTQEGSAVDDQHIAFGEPASRPADPMRIGAVFTGWYTDADCGAEALYDFGTPVTSKLTLYAGWLVPEPNGVLKLPAALTAVEAEAFSGIAAEAVIIPGTVVSISGNPFAGSGVRYVYGFAGTAAETLADTVDGLTFVPIDNTWMAGH